MTAFPKRVLVLALASAAGAAGSAQAQAQDPHAAHGHPAKHAGHSGHDAHASHDHDPHAAHRVTGAHDTHDAHEAPATPVPPLTDADRAAAFPVLRHHGMQHAGERTGYLLFDRLEAWDSDPGSGQAWEATGWWGGDTRRLWLRSEGERVDGRMEQAHVELLYGRSVSPWWDVLAGVRHDLAPGASRDWLAVGVQGLAPYLVEVSATAYLGTSGRGRLDVEAEYDLLLTNRLILQPALEASAHREADPARGVGSGLSTLEAGLRLRYEPNPHVAPYIGVVHERSFGETARLRRADGGSGRDTHVVAGIRFWF